MGHEFSSLMKRPWTTTPWKSFFGIHGIFNAIKRPWKGTQNFHGVFMSISWICPKLKGFHGPWKLKDLGVFNGFFNVFFFMLFPRWHAMKNLIRFPMKIPLKSFENPVNLPWINSQDFHGFLVHSVYYSELSRMRFTKTKLGIVKTLVFFKNNFERL